MSENAETENNNTETTILSNSETGNSETSKVNNEVSENSSTSSFKDLIDENGSFKSDWYKNLPSELKEAEKTLSSKGWKNPEDILKSYISLEKYSSKKLEGYVKLPGEGASEEEILKFKESLGVPKDPKDYGFEKPEGVENWDENFANSFAEFAHKNNISKEAAKGLVELYNGKINEISSKAEDFYKVQQEEQIKELRSEFGNDFDKKVKDAIKAADYLGIDRNDPLLGNNAKLIKALVKVSSLINEDSFENGERTSLQTKIAEIEHSDAYHGKLGGAAQIEALNRLRKLKGY